MQLLKLIILSLAGFLLLQGNEDISVYRQRLQNDENAPSFIQSAHPGEDNLETLMELLVSNSADVLPGNFHIHYDKKSYLRLFSFARHNAVYPPSGNEQTNAPYIPSSTGSGKSKDYVYLLQKIVI